MKEITYLIYIILFEGFIWAGCFYAVFVLNHSGWWFLLASIVGSAAYPPERWIHGKIPEEKEND